MDVDGALAEVEVDEPLFELTNASNRAFQYLLDEDALLRVHDLVIALFQLAVDLNVLDVQHGVVGELFFQTPIFDILYA